MSKRVVAESLRASACSFLGPRDRHEARSGARRPIHQKPVQVPELSSNHPQGWAMVERSLPEAGTTMFIGIDVSKDRLDVAVRGSELAFSVSYDEPGLTELVKRL